MRVHYRETLDLAAARLMAGSPITADAASNSESYGADRRRVTVFRHIATSTKKVRQRSVASAPGAK